jgi:hypothetical protein
MFIILMHSPKPITMWKPEGCRASEKVSSLNYWHRSREKWFDWLNDQILTVRSVEQVANSCFLMQTSRPTIPFEWNESIMYSNLSTS